MKKFSISDLLKNNFYTQTKAPQEFVNGVVEDVVMQGKIIDGKIITPWWRKFFIWVVILAILCGAIWFLTNYSFEDFSPNEKENEEISVSASTSNSKSKNNFKQEKTEVLIDKLDAIFDNEGVNLK